MDLVYCKQHEGTQEHATEHVRYSSSFSFYTQLHFACVHKKFECSVDGSFLPTFILAFFKWQFYGFTLSPGNLRGISWSSE